MMAGGQVFCGYFKHLCNITTWSVLFAHNKICYYVYVNIMNILIWNNIFLTEFSLLPVYKTPGLTPGRGQNIFNCDYNQPPPPGQVCDVDIKGWAPCTQENHYSYHRNAPCVFLKLNKIYGWIPEYYNASTNLPEKMPAELKEHIQKEETTGGKKVSIRNIFNYSCIC